MVLLTMRWVGFAIRLIAGGVWILFDLFVLSMAIIFSPKNVDFRKLGHENMNETWQWVLAEENDGN